MYLEGSDQHRGWFQSSLLVGLGTRGSAPFREVVTHGFIVAEDGRKMSKSLGNTIAPQDIIKQSGADILRLWVSMSDYTQEIRIGKEILARAVEAYRKIRNTLRYLVANLYDFDPAADAVRREDMEEVDRYMMARYSDLSTKVLRAYTAYDWSTIFQAVNQFATVDLSAFYADVSKDRLYTFAARSHARRSGQTALYTIADGLTRLLAPLLAFTADEIWPYLPGRRNASVHMSVFPSQAELDAWADPDLVTRWEQLAALRDRVLAQIEPLRKDKRIGSSLQAKVILSAPPAELALLEQYAAQLPMLFIVSEVQVTASADAATHIQIVRADGTKCERCWRYVPTVSADPAWAGLCSRCQNALAEPARG
jgi:isoleucyl-tRNA synthetase